MQDKRTLGLTELKAQALAPAATVFQGYQIHTEGDTVRVGWQTFDSIGEAMDHIMTLGHSTQKTSNLI